MHLMAEGIILGAIGKDKPDLRNDFLGYIRDKPGEYDYHDYYLDQEIRKRAQAELDGPEECAWGEAKKDASIKWHQKFAEMTSLPDKYQLPAILNYFEAIRKGSGYVEYALTMMNCRVCPYAVNEKGDTILLEALKHRYEKMAELFIDILGGTMPGLLNVRNEEGWTALSYALVSGLQESFETLCQTAGVDPNVKVHGVPPFVDAVLSGKRKNVELMLAMPGLDIYAMDEQKGIPAIDIANMATLVESAIMGERYKSETDPGRLFVYAKAGVLVESFIHSPERKDIEALVEKRRALTPPKDGQLSDASKLAKRPVLTKPGRAENRTKLKS
jgi:hypothetical protein